MSVAYFSLLGYTSTKDDAAPRSMAGCIARLLVADFTTLVLQTTQTLAGLSTALGVVTARLVGLTLVDALAGLDEELAGTRLTEQQKAANLQLAHAAYALADSWAPLQERTGETFAPAQPLVEVTLMAPDTQAKLLRTLQERTIRPVGSVREVPVKVRIIASTNLIPTRRFVRAGYARICTTVSTSTRYFSLLCASGAKIFLCWWNTFLLT